MTIIRKAEKTDVYWPQGREKYFTLRYCIVVDGMVIPVYKNFRTCQEAYDYLSKAHAEQGFVKQGGDA